MTVNPLLQDFVESYRNYGVPSPYILLTGIDEARNVLVACEFAQALGVEASVLDCAAGSALGDLAATLTGQSLGCFSGVQNLKRPLLEQLIHALEDGELPIRIGAANAARTHTLDLAAPAIVVTCPTKSECPALLLRQISCVISVEPYTAEEMLALLEHEASKNRVVIEAAAAELLVRCGNGISSLMLYRFRKVVGQIQRARPDSEIHLTVEETSLALAKLRIQAPSSTPPPISRDLDGLSGHEFELLIKALLTEMGFQADLTEMTGDGGIDVVAKLDRPFSGGRYIFQCKRYGISNLIGSPAIRDFYGAVTADRAVKGIFITTSDFTSQAKEFAHQAGIELVNRTKLLQLLDDFKVASS